MSVTATVRKAGPYSGNGITTSFPFDFKVFAEADSLVVQNVSNVETDLTLGTDYTVELNEDQDNDPGGTVVFGDEDIPTSGVTITITSNIGITQPAVFTNNGGFYPAMVNKALDRLIIICQQIAGLESTVTERRYREAVLGIDNGWLKNLNDEIASLRAQLKQ